MGGIKLLLMAGLVVATTVACTQHYGYSSAGYSSGYYSNGGYRYSGSPSYSYRTPRYGAYGDYDRDGRPNAYDRDANGDRVPDRYQRY